MHKILVNQKLIVIFATEESAAANSRPFGSISSIYYSILMKQFLLTSGLLALALTAAATGPELNRNAASMADNVKTINVRSSRTTGAKSLAPGVSLSTNHGIKRLTRANAPAQRIMPTLHAQRRAEAPNGYTFFESFENWDGEDYEWTPDGWTVEMRGEVERDESWSPAAEDGLWSPPVPDGNYYYSILFSYEEQDEWLISPYVEIIEGMDLSYWAYIEPVFLFNLDTVDWDAFEFTEEPTVAATLQIWAQAEGEEWVMLRDYFDEYKDYSFEELYLMMPAGLEKQNVSLADYYGKNTRVAFRYVGRDGNTMFIDAVGIGYPALEDVSYSDPFDVQYWGLTRSPELLGLTTPVAQYPVFVPITWTNYDVEDNVEYTWSYSDPTTGEIVTTNEDPYELSVTYVPDYSTEATCRNNLYYPPTLTASAEYATPGSYTAPYALFQAGGKAETTLSDNSNFEACLLPFNMIEQGIGMLTVDDATIGDMSIPVFGHNVNTDQYWLNYSLNGEPANPGDFSHLLGIANLIWPTTDAPLVVNGVNVYGYGKIANDAELKVTIYGISESMTNDIETFTTIATKSITGADILREDENKDYLCIPFDFDTPAVVQRSDENPAFFVMFEGFNSDKVEYFAPLQSTIPDESGLCLGYILNEIDITSHISGEPYFSLKPMCYEENGEYIDLANSFAIGLDAEYPWLTCDDPSPLVFKYQGYEVERSLGSYYDGTKLTVEAPEGVEATVTGRYNNCVLKVHNPTLKEGKITVSGPGVSLTFDIEILEGISAISADAGEISTVYDLSGRIVTTDNLAPGVYIVVFDDGRACKLRIK